MRKFFSIAIASLLIVSSFASCGSSETSSSEATSSKAESSVAEEQATEEVTEEATEEETTEEATEEETTEADEEEGTSESEEETSAFEMPELVPDEAAEADFVGKWECSKIISTDGVESDLMGIPLSVLVQFEIKEDKTATMSSLMSEEESQAFIWEYADNTVTVTSEDDPTPTNCILQGGDLVFYDEDNEMQMYFVKVDEFTEMTDEELQALVEEWAGSMDIDTGSDSDEDADVQVGSGEDGEEETTAEMAD